MPKGQPISGALLADDVTLSMFSFRGPVDCRFCRMVSCHNCHPQPSIKHWLTCFWCFCFHPAQMEPRCLVELEWKYVVICFTCFKNTMPFTSHGHETSWILTSKRRGSISACYGEGTWQSQGRRCFLGWLGWLVVQDVARTKELTNVWTWLKRIRLKYCNLRMNWCPTIVWLYHSFVFVLGKYPSKKETC